MLAPALLLGFGETPSSLDTLAELSRGSALYRVCQAEVRVIDLPSLTGAAEADLLNGSYCVGYLNGYMANLHRGNGICTGGAAIGALVRVYVSFMDKNADLLSEEKRLGLNLALRDAYPCPVDGTPGPGGSADSRAAL